MDLEVFRSYLTTALNDRSGAQGSRPEQLRQGRILPSWQDQPATLRQVDCNARWKVKYDKAKAAAPRVTQPKLVDIAGPIFGYQNNSAIDRACGLIFR